MFHPIGHPLERGWVGRVEDERVVQLAAQTLQSFFTGGGTAREHAEYPIEGVRLLAPVLHPPAIRVFDDPETFAFANPAAVLGPGACVGTDASDTVSRADLAVAPRLAAVIGAAGDAAAFTLFAEWRDPSRRPPKDRDFALGVGPVAVTADAFDPLACVQVVRVDGRECLRQGAPGFRWDDALALAAERTRLYPGDLVAGPACGLVQGIAPGSRVEIEAEGIGVLEQATS